MTTQVTIPVATLKRAAELLLDRVEKLEGPVIAVDDDYFWSIPPDELYDVMSEPSELTIGQLSESLDNIDGVLADPDRATRFALVWLADLARAVGHSGR